MSNLKKGLLIPLLLLTTFLYSQSNTLRGKVVSSKDNLALNGATVLFKGTNNSTVSAAGGSFSLQGQSTGNTLVLYRPSQYRSGGESRGHRNFHRIGAN